MGLKFTDQYSLLHFATGVVAYFFRVSFHQWFIIHLLFELLENTQSGVNFIDTTLTWWPGGKQQPDSIINSIGDQMYSLIGWGIAFYLEQIFGDPYTN